MDEPTLGQLVKRARDRQGMTGKELAARLDGMDPSTLSRLENDRFTEMPSPGLLRLLKRELSLRDEDMLRALGYLRDVPKPTTGNTEEDARRSEAHTIIDQMDEAKLSIAVVVLTGLARGVTAADLRSSETPRRTP